MNRELVFIRAGFGADALPYQRALDLQRDLHARRVGGAIPDTCLLLEHTPVYTAGRRTSPADRPLGDPGAPVIEVDRGGKITWHGPGQLVGYPIVALDEPIDVISYVRAIEDALIGACADAGLATTRVPGRSGVWVPAGEPGRPADQGSDDRGPDHRGPDNQGTAPRASNGQDRKVAAIGIRVARGVTMHGFALNCSNDLSWFDRIVPCGISDAAVTSLSAELQRPVTVSDAADLVEWHLADVLGATTTRHLAGIEELMTSAGVSS